MRKNKNIPAYVIALLLFILPFFWLRHGFVNLGGDSGRLYFFEPLAILKSSLNFSNSAYGYSFAIIPYFILILPHM